MGCYIDYHVNFSSGDMGNKFDESVTVTTYSKVLHYLYGHALGCNKDISNIKLPTVVGALLLLFINVMKNIFRVRHIPCSLSQSIQLPEGSMYIFNLLMFLITGDKRVHFILYLYPATSRRLVLSFVFVLSQLHPTSLRRNIYLIT
jgi:hypothetical protein